MFCLFGNEWGMDALSRYLEGRGERISSFAVRIGRSPSTLTRALSGDRNPSVGLARDVERGSGGAVSAEEFIRICMAAAPSDGAVPHAPVAAGPDPQAGTGHLSNDAEDLSRVRGDEAGAADDLAAAPALSVAEAAE